jgi:hypothetical protein
MKIISNRFLTVVLVLMGSISAFAGEVPPAPDSPEVEIPPELPIDGNLVFLVVAALLFGIYSIYKHRLNEKTPV